MLKYVNVRTLANVVCFFKKNKFEPELKNFFSTILSIFKNYFFFFASGDLSFVTDLVTDCSVSYLF